MDIKWTIADRLKGELARKGLDAAALAKEAGIGRSCVEAYLRAQKDVCFDELRPLCAALGIRLMALLGRTFELPHLQYRSASVADRRAASTVESAFVLLAEFLPKPKTVPNAASISERETDIQFLLAEIRASVEGLRKTLPTVEALYLAADLPILPISAGSDGFDAFLLTLKKRAIVCINRDKPPARIHFSLLHEMAHYLFHANRDIPVDILGDDYYAETIRPDVLPEYVANKFAQQYLVPFDLAESLAATKTFPENLTALLLERRTTPHVLANAIYDCLRMRPNRPRYLDLSNDLKAAAGTGWGSDRSVLIFAEEAGKHLRQAAAATREHFSDEVWATVSAAWELDHA